MKIVLFTYIKIIETRVFLNYLICILKSSNKWNKLEILYKYNLLNINLLLLLLLLLFIFFYFFSLFSFPYIFHQNFQKPNKVLLYKIN